MHLVDNIDGVLAYLRRYSHLVNQRTDILDRVIGSGIEFVDIERPLLIEGLATLALIAGVKSVLRVKTVNGFRENTRTGGFAHSSRSAEEICMRQMVLTDSVLQRLGERLLTDDLLKCRRPGLTR